MSDETLNSDQEEEEFGRGQEVQSEIIHNAGSPDKDKIEKLIEEKKAGED